MSLPTDVINIILDYYSQLRESDMKWTPFIETTTGKLKWKVNKNSTKYDNIHKLLTHRKDHIRHDISIDINIVANSVTLDSYNTIGTCIVLQIEYIEHNYQFIEHNYQMIVPKTYLYIEYFDINKFKYSTFYSIFGRSTLRRFDYDVYQDNNIHSMLIDIHKFGNNYYSLVLEKY